MINNYSSTYFGMSWFRRLGTRSLERMDGGNKTDVPDNITEDHYNGEIAAKAMNGNSVILPLWLVNDDVGLHYGAFNSYCQFLADHNKTSLQAVQTWLTDLLKDGDTEAVENFNNYAQRFTEHYKDQS